MPAPGDQHTSWTNPFEETKPRVSEWTAKEIATISARLDKQLGPEYISARAGPGGSKVHYLTAEKCISLANEVFGFNGWSSSIQNIQVDFADENPQTQRVSIGLSVIVRVTLRDGTYHEDIGYGSIENAKGKAMAFEKAKKEGTTDGLKRALRRFGNVLGNCIYDQDYVKQVVKLKAQPVKKFDQNNLHRHADFVTKEVVNVGTAANNNVGTGLKPEPADSFEDFLGELDEADFCVSEGDHPDEMVIISVAASHDSTSHAPRNAVPPPPRPMGPAAGAGSSNRGPQTPNWGQSCQNTTAGNPQAQNRPQQTGQAVPVQGNPSAAGQNGASAEPVAFFSAKALRELPEANQQGHAPTHNQLPQPHGGLLFNPKAESPSIRKTPGIDHSSSKPLARNGQHVPPSGSQSGAGSTSNGGGFTPVRPSAPGAGRGNVINPNLDHARRIGAPGAAGSPLSNRGSYKPPAMKRPIPGEAALNAGTRPPLADLPGNVHGSTNTSHNDGLDAKRQKMA